MRTRQRLCRLAVTSLGSTLAVILAIAGADAGPVGLNFTYQGQLQQGPSPIAASACDFEFTLFDGPVGGAQVGSPQVLNNVSVNGGVFTVQLNAGNEFGAAAFSGDARWLEAAVRCPAGVGTFSAPFTPRQQLTATPYALFALTANLAQSLDCDGCIGTGVLANGSVSANKLASGAVNGSAIADGSITAADLANGVVTPQQLAGGAQGQVLVTTGGVVQWEAPCADWTLAGNAGTTATTNFLGTTDVQPLEFRVNNRRALRIEPGPLCQCG